MNGPSAHREDIPREAQAWLASLAIEPLSAAEEGELNKLELQQEARTQEVQAYQRLIEELNALPEASISPSLQARLERLSEQSHGAWPWRKMVAALLLVGAAWLGWQQLQPNAQFATQPTPNVIPKATGETPPSAAPTDIREGFALAAAPSTQANGSVLKASISFQPGKPTNLLEVQGLSALPQGQTYRLWAVNADGDQGCVTFQPDATGQVVMQIPKEPTGSAERVLISVDSVQAGRASTSPGEPVLLSI